MKKRFWILCAVFINFAGVAFAYDTEFKNPIFNQPLRPLSNHNGLTFITPTSIEYRTPLDENLIDATGECDLIENEQDHVTLLCDIHWRDSTWKSYLKFVIKRLHFEGCLIISKYSYENEKAYLGNQANYSAYCVTPPEDMTSEPN